MMHAIDLYVTVTDSVPKLEVSLQLNYYFEIVTVLASLHMLSAKKFMQLEALPA